MRKSPAKLKSQLRLGRPYWRANHVTKKERAHVAPRPRTENCRLRPQRLTNTPLTAGTRHHGSKFLDPLSLFHFACIDIPLGIYVDGIDPVELSRIFAVAAE